MAEFNLEKLAGKGARLIDGGYIEADPPKAQQMMLPNVSRQESEATFSETSVLEASEIMNEQTEKCRICLEVKEKKICVGVTTKWTNESSRTVKDAILLCVPWMSIKDDSYLCKTCLWQLKFTHDFLEKCLKTENILNEENNLQKLTLEDILEKSLLKGNTIKIIFENSPNTQQADSTDIIDDVIDHREMRQKSYGNPKKVNIKINTADTALQTEHNYCVKSGTQIDVNFLETERNNFSTVTESQQSNNVSEQNFAENNDRSVNQAEKENIGLINISDSDDDNDALNDSTTEPAGVENVPDNHEISILQSILSSKNKNRRSKTVLKSIDLSKILDPEQAKLDKELKTLLDISPVNTWFLCANSEITTVQQDDLVRDGVNILDMSKDPNKKKRTIYLCRDSVRREHLCCKCNLTFHSRCDYLDHVRLHRRGKIQIPGEPIFTCNICLETFTLDIDLRGHSRANHGVLRPHQCTRCNKKFRYFGELKQHTELFKDQDKCSFKCKRCNREFTKLFAFVNHEKEVEDAPCCDFEKCGICLKKFTKEDFKIHCSTVHSSYLCPECGKSFSKSANLSSHIKYVHNNINTMCHECGKVLSHRAYLEHHMQSVHGTKRYMCDKCPRQFSCQGYLRKHMRTHLPPKHKFRCETCGNAYARKESLKQHNMLVHLGVTRYCCTICNEGFARKDYLNRHINNHTTMSINTCPVCNKSFGSNWRLEYHIFAGHDENGKSLETLPMRRPPGMKKENGGEKALYKLVCKICNKALGNKPSLMLHYKAHLNLRQAKCDICGVIFQGSLALKNHKKLHDDPNFEFSCSICHAYKSSSRELENHMLEVHKNKKYKCKLCSEKFGRIHLLRSHETIVHQEEIQKKKAILEMLKKNQIRVPADLATNTDFRSKKGGNSKKVLEVDIDTVYDQLVNSQNDSDIVPGSSKAAFVAGKLNDNFVESQTPSHKSLKQNVFTLNNEYRAIEDARACKVLEEEYEKNNS